MIDGAKNTCKVSLLWPNPAVNRACLVQLKRRAHRCMVAPLTQRTIIWSIGSGPDLFRGVSSI
jgi:hypothetical protein